MKKCLLVIVLLFSFFAVFAQVSKPQAASIVLGTIPNDRIDSVNVYVESVLQTNSYYMISFYDSIQSPYTQYWLFFVDNNPEYLWGHGCQYVFVNQNNGQISTILSQTPPSTLNETFEIVQEPILTTFETSCNPRISDCMPTPIYDENNGKYAVLFCGGEKSLGDPTYFWNALSHSYSSLIENGFKKENIYVLSCDGGTGVNFGSNPSLDLDNDESIDILPIPCSVANLRNTFSNISVNIQEGDMLFVYALAHGYKDDITQKNYIHLWNYERLYDCDFASMLSTINCSHIIVNIYACCSGGMADDIAAINNNVKKTILTCTNEERAILRDQVFPAVSGMDQYNYLMCSAFRGWHPDYHSSAPWCQYETTGNLGLNEFHELFPYSIGDCDYDLTSNGGNNDRKWEINEVINYVKEYEPYDFNNYGVKIYDCGFEEDLLCLHGITGKVTSTNNVNGTFHIEDVLEIDVDQLVLNNNGAFYLFDADITINHGSELSFANNTSLIARSGHCKIIVNGTLSCESNVTFRAEDGASLEIIFNNGADLELSGVTFENCQLTLPQRNVTFNSCTFKGTPVQLVLSSSQRVNGEMATLRNCTFMPNGIQIPNALYIKNYSQFLVSNCSFLTDNGFFRNGIYIQGAGGNSGVKQVTNNDITGCIYAGLQLYGATASVVGNRIYGNGVGVKLLNNSNISSFSGNCAASDETLTQYIHNNTSYEVYMTGSSIPQTFRYNAICDNGNTPFVYHESNIAQVDTSTPSTRSGSIDVAYNYWGTNFTPSLHLCTDISDGYLYTPYWTMGECLSVNDRAARQLAEADSLNDAGDYSGASAAYRSVVHDYPNSISSETALKTLLTLEEETGENYGQLKSYYTGNTDIASDSVLSNLADNLANKCDVALKNYQDAIEWYENVINDPETSYCDSIFAVIDLGDLYLEMEENGEKAIGKMSQFKPQSKEKHYIQTEKSLELLPACKNKNSYPVRELTAEHNENNIVLKWNYPAESTLNQEAVLTWSNGEGFTEMAYSGERDYVAHRYDSLDLMHFDGWIIKQISMIPISLENTYAVNVWVKNRESYELVCSQEVQNMVCGEWNQVDLEEGVVIDSSKEYLIGYSSVGEGYYTLAGDLERTVPNKNMLMENGEWSVSPMSLHNWMIRATITAPENRSFNRDATSLVGYNIFREGELVTNIPYAFQSYYIDESYNEEFPVEYCVKAVYKDSESEAECVRVKPLSIPENNKTDSFKIFPNPTNDLVRIEGGKANEIKVYNGFGQLVMTYRNTNEIEMKGLPKGVYTLCISSEQGWSAKRIILQ